MTCNMLLCHDELIARICVDVIEYMDVNWMLVIATAVVLDSKTSMALARITCERSYSNLT